jgi:hypothetical protein
MMQPARFLSALPMCLSAFEWKSYESHRKSLLMGVGAHYVVVCESLEMQSASNALECVFCFVNASVSLKWFPCMHFPLAQFSKNRNYDISLFWFPNHLEKAEVLSFAQIGLNNSFNLSRF